MASGPLDPGGAELVAPYYDVGAGLRWRLAEGWSLRAELSLRGARAGLSYGW